MGPTVVSELIEALDAYDPRSRDEVRDLARIREAAASGDPWRRDAPLHVTGSALVVHPPTVRVLLRWHDRMQQWLQVGGHGDPGESDPFAVARREAQEESGLHDLGAWPDSDHPMLLHVIVVPVPAAGAEPAHEHADLRYLLATEHPGDIVPEHAGAHLRWLEIDDARRLTGDDNVGITLARAEELLR
jgi:8-oxo-dGTP pyrophosphatase MutT (NUDIX family)